MTIYDRPIKNGREHIAQEFLTALLEWETSNDVEVYPLNAVLSLTASPPISDLAAPANQAAAGKDHHSLADNGSVGYVAEDREVMA